MNLRELVVRGACSALLLSACEREAPAPAPPLPPAPVAPPAPAAENAATQPPTAAPPPSTQPATPPEPVPPIRERERSARTPGAPSSDRAAQDARAQRPTAEPKVAPLAAPAEPIVAPPSQPPPPAAQPAASAPAKKVAVPATDHVRVEVPRGLQALLDADPRMQPWIDKVITVIDRCYAAERARAKNAAGTVEIAITMHVNARPDADVQSVPAQLGGVVACATPELMRARPPLFTGPEGERHALRIRFTQ